MKTWRTLNLATTFGMACGLLGIAPATEASTEILCSNMSVVECSVAAPCEKTPALAVETDTPLFLRLNLEEKKVETIRSGDLKQTTDIRGIVRGDGLLLLQGMEPARPGERSALGWTMSIDESTGNMVITASGRDVGYTLFGACTSIE